MANKRRIDIAVGLVADKASIENLKQSLQNITRETNLSANKMNAEYKQAADTAQHLLDILDKSYNKTLGAVNVSKFSQELKKANLSAETIRNSLKGAGFEGARAFNQLGSQVLGTNLKLRETNKLLDSMATSMANTVKWGITSSIFNTVTNSIQKAYDYSVDLNESLNNIRIVTNKSKEEMQDFAEAANRAAKSLGSNTLSYTDASLIYYQQGLSNNEVEARTEATIKAANVAGTSAEQMSEYLTSVWNGYKVSADEAELYIDKLSAVAATTAADLEELSVGMSKVASAANAMGVDVDQLNAQLATIVSVTRQAPESVGTALKTIYARMTDIQTGMSEDGVTLGSYTEDMAEMGINVLNTNGQLRDTGEVMEEIGEKWSSFSREQQFALAQTMAGTRQYNNLIALFDNWEDYEKTLNTSREAIGTLQSQQDIYMESTESKLQILKATWQDLYGSLIDNDTLNEAIESITNLVETFDKFIDSFGGGTKALSAFGVIAANIFNKQIGNAIAGTIKRFTEYTQNIDTLKAKIDFTQQTIAEIPESKNLNNYLDAVGEKANYEIQLEYAKEIMTIQNAISQDKYNELTTLQKELGLLAEKKAILEEQQKIELEQVFGKRKSKEVSKKIDDPEAFFNMQSQYAEQMDQDEIVLDVLDSQKEKIQNIINLKKQGQKITNEEKKIEEALLRIQEKLTKEEAQAILKEKNRLKNLKEENRDYSKIYAIIEKIEKIKKNSASQTQKEAEAVEKVFRAREKEAEVLDEIKNKERDFNSIFNEEKIVARVNNTVTAITSLSSSLVSLWGGINSLISVWSDDTMEKGDQISQTISTMLFLIPTLISALEKLNTLRGVSATLTDVAIAKSKAKIAWDAAEVTGVIALTTKQKLAVLWENLLTEAKTKGLISKKATVATLTLEQKQHILNALATSKNTIAIKSLTAAQNALNASLLANPWTWIIAGLGVAIGLLSKYSQEAKEAAEAQRQLNQENRDKSLENYEKLKEEAIANQDLYEKVLQLNQGYKQGVVAREELLESLEKLLDGYGIEIQSIQDLIENYDLLIKTIRQGKHEEWADIVNSTIVASSDTDSVIKDTVLSFERHWLSGVTIPEKAGPLELDEFRVRLNKVKEGKEGYAEYALIQSLFDEMMQDSEKYGLTVDEDTKGHVSYHWPIDVEQFGNVIEFLTSEDTNRRISDAVMADSDDDLKFSSDSILYISELRRKTEAEIKKRIELREEEWKNQELRTMANWGTEDWYYPEMTSLDWGLEEIYKMISDRTRGYYKYKDVEYDALKGDYVETNKNKDKTFEDYLNVTEEYFKTVYPHIDDSTYRKMDSIRDIVKKAYGVESFSGVPIPEDLEDQLSIHVTTLEQQLLNEYLSEATLSKLQTYDFSKIKDDANAINNVLDIFITKDKADSFKTEAEEIENLIKKLKSKNELNEEEISLVEELNRKYTTLGLIQDKNSEGYINALQEINADLRDRSVEAYYEYLNKSIQAFADEDFNNLLVGVKPNPEDIKRFNERMKEIQSAAYEVVINVEANISKDFERIGDMLDTYEEAAAFVGENYIVDVKNLQELNSVYPGILENMQDLQNGTIQLDKQVAKEVINNQREIVKAKIQASIESIKDQRNTLQRYEDFARGQAKIALEMTGEEEKNQEILAGMVEGLATFEAKINEEKNDIIAKDDKEAAEESSKNNEDAAKDAKERDRVILSNGVQAAQQYAQAWSYALEVAAGKHNDKTFDEISATFDSLKTFLKEEKFNSQINEEKAKHYILGGQEIYGPPAPDYLNTDLRKITERVEDAFEGDTKEGQYDPSSKSPSNITFKTTYQTSSGEYDPQKIADAWLTEAERIENLDKILAGYLAEEEGRLSSINNIFDNMINGLGGKTTAALGDSKKDAKEMIELAKKLLTNYHDIEVQLKQIEAEYSKLEKASKKALGKDLIENYNKQLELLHKKSQLNKEKLEAMQLDISINKRPELEKLNLSFNADNTISNYADWYNDWIKKINEATTTYNNNRTEENEKHVEKLKDQFEKELETIEEYEEMLLETIPEVEEQIADSFDKQIELRMAKFNNEIEIRLEMAEAERDWNEFKKNVIDKVADDDILGNAKARLQDFHSYYKDGETEGAIKEATRHINDILFELGEMDNGIMSNFYGDNKAAAFEDLKKYYEQLMGDLTAVEELSEEVRQSYLDMMDKAQEDFDKQINKYEQITDLIDHDMKLIELLHGDKSYTAFDTYYKKQEENYNQQLDFQKRQVDFWAAEMEAAKDDAERWAIAEENWSSAVTEWKSLINTAIENIQDKYLNTIKSIFEELNNKVTDGAGLEYVNEQWGLINRNAEEYLDAINAMYGIEDLEKKYLDAIDNTDSISAQRQLNELMEKEVAALEEKDKLTQYDVDRALKRYDIALKQIALEEAQQNKTSMRLKRDSQGNYSYEFTADEDAVGKAEDELAAAQNALYNFDKENYINNLDKLYAAYEEYQEKMFEAAQINDPEERKTRELLINEQYEELITALTEQNQTIRNNLYESAFEEHSRLMDKELEEYLNMTQAQKDELMEGLIPQWDSGVQHMADVFAGEGGFTEVCKDAMTQLSEATKTYNKDLEEIEKSAELTFKTVVDGTDQAIIDTNALILENDKLIQTYEDELTAVQAVITELDKLIEKFDDARLAAIEASKAAYAYQQAQRGDFDADDFSDTPDYSRVMTDRVQSMSGTKNYEVSKDEYIQQLMEERQQKINRDNTVTSVDNNRFLKVLEAYADPEHDKHNKAVELMGLVDSRQLDYTDETLKKYGFNTGGYTGVWAGSAGRVALLHQKELVLNSEDTRNMLNAVQVLRAIDSSVLQRIAGMSGAIGFNNHSFNQEGVLEQDVHIEAHFPNVTNSKEIENALDNLINTASQRALRK